MMCDMREKSARSRKMARRAKAITWVESGAIAAAEEGAESATSRRRGRARHSRGSSDILHWCSNRCDSDQWPAVAINGTGIAVSAADVGWDISLRRWGAERASKDPMDDCACVRAGAGSRELHIGQVPAQLARTTPKIERVRTIFRRDLHQLILGWPGPIVALHSRLACSSERFLVLKKKSSKS